MLAMTALETVLLIVVLLLGTVLGVAIVTAGRLLRVVRPDTAAGDSAAGVAYAGLSGGRGLAEGPGHVSAVEPVIDDALTDTASNLSEVRATIIGTRSAAAAARADAAAAKAEAAAARAEVRRILESARGEAEGILERAHKQGEHDAEQLRVSARRAGEREIATLTNVAKEQASDAERRQQRLDDRERLLADD